jgi:hypothetical protein
VRLDHLLSRELTKRPRTRVVVEGVAHYLYRRFPKRRPDLEMATRRPRAAACMLFSFERPDGGLERPPQTSHRTLKTAQWPKIEHLELQEAAARLTRGAKSPSRYEGHVVDALAPGADEGRGRLR